MHRAAAAAAECAFKLRMGFLLSSEKAILKSTNNYQCIILTKRCNEGFLLTKSSQYIAKRTLYSFHEFLYHFYEIVDL